MGGQRQKMNAIATILTESPPIPLQISQQLMLKLNTSDPGRKWEYADIVLDKYHFKLCAWVDFQVILEISIPVELERI